MRLAPFWKARYRNGATVDSSFWKYNKIDREQLCEFIVLAPDGKEIYKVNLTPKQTLVYRRRTTLTLHGRPLKRVYICGVVEDGLCKLSFIEPETGRVFKVWEGPFKEADIEYTEEELLDIRRRSK